MQWWHLPKKHFHALNASAKDQTTDHSNLLSRGRLAFLSERTQLQKSKSHVRGKNKNDGLIKFRAFVDVGDSFV